VNKTQKKENEFEIFYFLKSKSKIFSGNNKKKAKENRQQQVW
jgi:hypothetical protein